MFKDFTVSKYLLASEQSFDLLAPLCYRIGKMLQAFSNLKDANTWYTRAIEIRPKFAEAHISLGYTQYKFWRVDLAIASYRRAIELNPQSWEAHNYLGLALAKQGQVDEAITHYHRAIELNPKAYWSHQRLGQVLVGIGCLEEAVCCYHCAIELNPTFYLSYFSLGIVLERQGKLEEAVTCYQKAVELNPEASIVHYHLGDALTKLGQSTAAISAYHQSIELNPNFCWDYHNLGNALMRKGQWHEAAEVYRKTIELKPNAESYVKLGDALTCERLRDTLPWRRDKIGVKVLDEAISCYQKAVRLNLNGSSGYLRLGNAFTTMGKVDEATHNYQMASYQTAIRANSQLINASWNVDNIRRPDFLIIGVTKCGTTSLQEYLTLHPQVMAPLQKEINFFSNYFENGASWYSSQFPPVIEGSKFITGEASSGYLAYPNVDQRVFSLLPDVKLIVLLRNPIDRAVSQYYHMIRDNQEKRTIEEALLSEIELLKVTSEAELNNCDYFNKFYGYILHGLYAYPLKRWMKLFPREQLLILKSEDLYENTSKTMEEVLSFLNLPSHFLSQYPNYHPGNYTSSLSDALRSKVAEFFRPHNEQLQDLLGMDFNW